MKSPTIKISDNADWESDSIHQVTWSHADEGWNPIPKVFDDFLAAAIRRIAIEVTAGDANWLFLNFEFGRLMVYPSAEGAFECTRSEQLFYQLHCDRIDKETGQYQVSEMRVDPDGETRCYVKTPDDVPVWVDKSTHQMISERKWGLVRDALTKGRAASELENARRTHPMRLAAFEFDPSEGAHYLPELTDPEFFTSWDLYQKEQRDDLT